MQNLAFAQTPTLEFSHKAGFHKDAFDLELEASAGTIYYTTNGATPNKDNSRYKEPISISETTIVRARVVQGKKSKVYSRTFFIDGETKFPVVSVGINPKLLHDDEKGFFVKGPNAEETYPYHKANFWTSKELTCHFEFFESDNKLMFSSNAGFRMFGGMSRIFPQKSVALVMRKRYGEKRFNHKVFKDKDIDKFKYLVVRNAGSDWGKGHCRDVLMTGLMRDVDIETQAARPCIMYLNGEYYGIYYLREKVNPYFLQSNCEVDKDSIDLIEHEKRLRSGSTRHYRKMLEYIKKYGLKKEKHYDYIKTKMEVDNFIDFQVAQIFFDNHDAGGNIKFWRPQTKDGRWRWILYDTDWGFGLHDADAYSHNSIDFHTTDDGPNWPNPPWSTLLLRSLLKNEDFKQKFILRFCDHMNTTFSTERVRHDIDSLEALLKPEMDKQIKKWDLSESKWKTHIKRMKNFAEERPRHMRMHLSDKFNLQEMAEFEIRTNGHGTVILNKNVKIKDKNFKGKYYKGIPITLSTEAKFGYLFSHWEVIEDQAKVKAPYLKLTPKNDKYTINAIFTKAESPLIGSVRISELNCANRDAGDWLELHNITEEAIDLKDWVLKDKSNKGFRLPMIGIPADDYIIVCRDTAKFRSVFPDQGRIVGGLSFGLDSQKDRVELYSDKDIPIDSLRYNIPRQDSSFTLNGLPYGGKAKWEIRNGLGNPGYGNSAIVANNYDAKKYIMYGGIALGAILLLFFLSFLFKKYA